MISLWFNHVFDLIPVWVWIVGAVVALAFTYQFWGPIWLMLPKPVKIALAAVAGVFTAYAAGRYKGAKNQRDMQAKRDAQAVDTRNKVETEVRNMSDDQVNKRMEKWTRPD